MTPSRQVLARSPGVLGPAWFILLAFGLTAAGLVACDGGGDPTGSPEPPADGSNACELSDGSDWTWTLVGSGQKPALVLDSQDNGHIAFILESLTGFIAYASVPQNGAAAVETVSNGYFYGPIAIGLSGGSPVVAYHDHTLEDQVLAVRTAGSWTLNPMTNGGHDGWYNAIAVDAAGDVHTASYDPSGFGGVGVVYGVWNGTTWAVEIATPGSFDYAGGMSIGLAPGGTPHVAFFDDVQGVARLAERDGSGTWSDQVIEAKGQSLEAGRFPDIAIDSGGAVHMVYLVRTATSQGVVRYAVHSPSGTSLTDVASVDDFTIGMAGARDLATIALDSQERPVVAIQNRSELTLARWNGASFDVRSFGAGPGVTLRQQTSLAVGAGDRAHVAYWVEAGTQSQVCYGVGP